MRVDVQLVLVALQRLLNNFTNLRAESSDSVFFIGLVLVPWYNKFVRGIMKKIMIICLCLLLFMVSCSKNEEEGTAQESVEEQPKELTLQEQKDQIDLSKKPNEFGQIMVLMYHNFGEEDTWTRSPENFRKDLQTLYDQGYRPISLIDYVTGNITTEAGYKPIVITVDDSRENNFRYLEDGRIDPDCGVGILVNFHDEHPDFPLEATFFSNGEVPFREMGYDEKKLNQLIELGMDLGNHTVNHPDFSEYTNAKDIQFEIGSQANYLESLAPSGYKVNTLALPFGSRPDESLEVYLQKGSYENKDYENIAILNVGWDPDRSPYHTDFNPLSIRRAFEHLKQKLMMLVCITG